MTLVSVMRDRYAQSWPTHEGGDRVYLLPLGDALERDYTTDAHFAAYATPNGRRLSREAIDRGIPIELTCVVFDVDCPLTHGTPEPAAESWRRGLRDKVQALAGVHPGLYYYETKGGARICYTQAEPTILRSQDDAQQWTRQYVVAVAYIARRFGIEADLACGDWQRLYRLPRATRGTSKKPENWPVWGDPNAIGSLTIDAEHDDVNRAKSNSKAFNERRIDLSPCSNGGDGLLYHALRARGEIGRPCTRGGWICLCPNRAHHTNKTDGSDATIVYAPSRGEEVGTICCLHAHCSGLSAKDWIRFFSKHELDAARAAAGIVRAA